MGAEPVAARFPAGFLEASRLFHDEAPGRAADHRMYQAKRDAMAAGLELDETRPTRAARRCVVLFCELRNIRQRLDLAPIGFRKGDAHRGAKNACLPLFEKRTRRGVRFANRRDGIGLTPEAWRR